MDPDPNLPTKNIEIALAFFKSQPDIGGFVIQKNDDKVEFDCHFSDSLLGKTSEEVYYTMVTIIAAMRNTSDFLTNRLADIAKISPEKVKEDVASQYFEITSQYKTQQDKKPN